jgi:hypothetical protein
VAKIYELQTNYRAKIEQSIELIEKGYIDQAICLLEDFLVSVTCVDIGTEIKKQLMSAYTLKREFDAVDRLIASIFEKKRLDLTIAAHDILVAIFQNQKEMRQQKENFYFNQLSSFSIKNLKELMYSLKDYYENYWYEQIVKKIDTLQTGTNLKLKFSIISDLYEVEEERLMPFTHVLEDITNSCEIPFVKTALFELMSRKNLQGVITFKANGVTRRVLAEPAVLKKMERCYAYAIERLEMLKLDECIQEELKQLLVYFYQYSFPFIDDFYEDDVIKELAQQVFGLDLEGLNSCETAPTNPDITYKMSQYILSLSSLM